MLQLEGALTGSAVSILAEVGSARLEDGRGLLLDLSGIDQVDAAGLALLQGWTGRGLTWRS